jgi:hypothetical protein
MSMKVRLTGIREAYGPSEVDSLEFQRGHRRRHTTDRDPEKTKEIVLQASLLILGTDGFDGFDLLLSQLPEGAKIGDEFEIEFRPTKKGSCSGLIPGR